MRSTVALLAAAVTVALTTGSQAEDKKSPQQLIDRSIKAIGGKEAVEKSRISVSSDKGTYHGMGEGLPYQGEFKSHYPDKMRVEIVGVFISVTDGEKAWISSMGQTMDLTGDMLKENLKQMRVGYITSLIPLQKPSDKFKLSPFGEAEVDGEACDGINVESKDTPTVTLFFSRKTGLMMRASYSVFSSEEQKEVTEEVTLSDYRKVEGVTTPMKFVINRDGKVYVKSEIQKVSFPKESDPNWFRKPE